MPLSVNDIIQVTVVGEKDGQAILNVFHYQCTTAPSTGSPAENIDALLAHLWAVDTGVIEVLWTAVMPQDYALLSVRGQKVNTPRGAYVEQLLIDNGDLDTDILDSANLTWVFIKQSETPGRRGRGPTHMLVPQTTWLNNGRLSSEGATARSQLVAEIDDVQTVAAGGVYAPVIYHPDFSPNFTRITHCTIKPEIRTMRRRTVGRGI